MVTGQPISLFVQDMRVEAQVGVQPEELTRRQPLLIDAQIDIASPATDVLGQTVDYRDIVRLAEALAHGGHITLIETFAQRLAQDLLALSDVRSVEVAVRKPQALAPAMAGVKIRLDRPA